MNYDSSTLPDRYVQARTLPSKTLNLWLETIATVTAATRVRRLLDLGCGTGRFTLGLRDRLSADVVGIDPSQRMLAQAAQASGVQYARATADEIPLPDGCIDVVFMSMVWHHFEAKTTVAKEVHRVLRSGGLVCVRNSTVETLDSCLFLHFFSNRPATQ